LLHDNRLVALVVPAAAEGGEEAVAAAIRATSQTLPSYRRVTDFAILRQRLPRTSLGKIRRFQLPDLYREAKAGRLAMRPKDLSPEDRTLLAAEPARHVWDWLHRQFPDRAVGMDASLATDIGIDSLAWVGLTLDLQETTGVRLTEERLARLDTVRDLLRAAVEAAAEPAAAAPATTAEPDQLLERPGPALRLVGSVVSGVNRLAFRSLFPLTVHGRENIPAQGPLLFAPNHLSYLDPFA